MLTFTSEEKALIVTLSVPGGWDDALAEPIKTKIKSHLLTQGDLCCYCLRSMHGWHRMTIDVEHVLPKSPYPLFTFEPKNLNLSCKRCNMRIKGERVSFFLGTTSTAAQFISGEYSFIHPNLDDFDKHIGIIIIQFNKKLLVKYKVADGSTKGAETYSFFRLNELERDSYDDAQGVGQVEPSDRMAPAIARELIAILATIE